MLVTLIAHTNDPEKTIAAAAKLCYSDAHIETLLDGLTPEKTAAFLQKLNDFGHASPIEHASFTFGIEGVSRTFLAQVTRHRIASFSVQSQRYVRLDDFRYVVPDFRLNKAFEQLDSLTQPQKDKVEFLCNECCWVGCRDRKRCYENVSRKNLGEDCPDHICTAPGAGEGYRFSKAMENPSFIGVEDIRRTFLPMGFSNFKIEGRGLGSALVLEFLLYYMVRPEYQLHVREAIYLDSMLDLF